MDLTILYGEHGEASEVSLCSYEVGILPIPSADTLKACGVGGGIDGELLTFRMISTSVSGLAQYTPLAWSGRPGGGGGVKLTHGDGDEAVDEEDIAILRLVMHIRNDILCDLIDGTLYDIGYVGDAAIDTLETGASDLAVTVIGAYGSVLIVIYVMPETTEEVIDDKLTRLTVIEVKHELTGMEGVIKVYDFLDTAFTCAIPAGA